MKEALRQGKAHLQALANLRRVPRASVWIVVGSWLLLASAQQSAYGLEFPMTSRLSLPTVKLTTTPEVPSEDGALFTTLTSKSSLFSTELASLAVMARLVEIARTKDGAKDVARDIAKSEYGWGKNQFACLAQLWGKESAWNYKAHNSRSGAHGIPQALPATKMEIVGTDWRTNPITQIRWGMKYIAERYTNPCSAWMKWKRKHHY